VALPTFCEYRVIDMRPMLWGEVFEQFKDQDFFKQVKETVVWPNNVNLCPDTLYSESQPVTFPTSVGVQQALVGQPSVKT